MAESSPEDNNPRNFILPSFALFSVLSQIPKTKVDFFLEATKRLRKARILFHAPATFRVIFFLLIFRRKFLLGSDIFVALNLWEFSSSEEASSNSFSLGFCFCPSHSGKRSFWLHLRILRQQKKELFALSLSTLSWLLRCAKLHWGKEKREEEIQRIFYYTPHIKNL